MSKPISAMPPRPVEPAIDWRDSLTPDERATIARAEKYVVFWAGAYTIDPLVLVAKLAKLLDEREINRS